MNIKQIYEDRIPKGATSFSTFENTTTFCIGSTGELVTILWSMTDRELLLEAELVGTFGKSND